MNSCCCVGMLYFVPCSLVINNQFNRIVMVLLDKDIKASTIILIFLLANSLTHSADSLTHNLEAVIDCEGR